MSDFSYPQSPNQSCNFYNTVFFVRSACFLKMLRNSLPIGSHLQGLGLEGTVWIFTTVQVYLGTIPCGILGKKKMWIIKIHIIPFPHPYHTMAISFLHPYHIMAIPCVHPYHTIAISYRIQCVWQEEEDVDHKDGQSQIKTTLNHRTLVSY